MPRQQFGTLFSQDSRNRTGDTQRALNSLMGASQFGGPLSTYDQIMRQMKRYQPVQPMPGRSQYLLPESMYWNEVNEYRRQIRGGADPNKLMEGYAARETARQKQKIEEQKIQAEYAKIGGELARDIEGREWEREKFETQEKGREASRGATVLRDLARKAEAEGRHDIAQAASDRADKLEGRRAEVYSYEKGMRPLELEERLTGLEKDWHGKAEGLTAAQIDTRAHSFAMQMAKSRMSYEGGPQLGQAMVAIVPGTTLDQVKTIMEQAAGKRDPEAWKKFQQYYNEYKQAEGTRLFQDLGRGAEEAAQRRQAQERRRRLQQQLTGELPEEAGVRSYLQAGEAEQARQDSIESELEAWAEMLEQYGGLR